MLGLKDAEGDWLGLGLGLIEGERDGDLEGEKEADGDCEGEGDGLILGDALEPVDGAIATTVESQSVNEAVPPDHDIAVLFVTGP